ncbi:hypothetical protein MSAN_01609500 [Mycena sanguinolenta]|uniref:Uncharacterized protein n=1 Tax=Mycena sanguinolenta TaxID=230812 RepID=A0A8H7CXG1_9AGAR|nr:hypothetical protein MSAN_01609500 [Mycena sanguinolenta]
MAAPIPRPKISRLPSSVAAQVLIARPALLRQHALHLGFVQTRKADIIADFISLCGAAVDIAFISSPNSESNHPDLSALTRTHSLHRLSFTLKALKQVFPYPDPFDGRHPFFSCITHLRILGWVDEWGTWSGLAQIPHLTHISTDSISDEALLGVLQHCRLLEVFVFVHAPQFHLYQKVPGVYGVLIYQPSPD